MPKIAIPLYLQKWDHPEQLSDLVGAPELAAFDAALHAMFNE